MPAGRCVAQQHPGSAEETSGLVTTLESPKMATERLGDGTKGAQNWTETPAWLLLSHIALGAT